MPGPLRSRVFKIQAAGIDRTAGFHRPGRNWSRIVPLFVLAPSIAASFIYVVVFSLWTVWISLSQSTLLPDYRYAGFRQYSLLWSNHRWSIAYTNLFIFGSLYLAGAATLGLLLAIPIDRRVRREALWRSIFLYQVAISIVVTGMVWRWIFNPTTGLEAFVRNLGFSHFSFGWVVRRDMAIYTVVITGSGRPPVSRWPCSWPGCAPSIATWSRQHA